jgi:hypothetical protein
MELTVSLDMIILPTSLWLLAQISFEETRLTTLVELTIDLKMSGNSEKKRKTEE